MSACERLVDGLHRLDFVAPHRGDADFELVDAGCLEGERYG